MRACIGVRLRIFGTVRSTACDLRCRIFVLLHTTVTRSNQTQQLRYCLASYCWVVYWVISIDTQFLLNSDVLIDFIVVFMAWTSCLKCNRLCEKIVPLSIDYLINQWPKFQTKQPMNAAAWKIKISYCSHKPNKQMYVHILRAVNIAFILLAWCCFAMSKPYSSARLYYLFCVEFYSQWNTKIADVSCAQANEWTKHDKDKCISKWAQKIWPCLNGETISDVGWYC